LAGSRFFLMFPSQHSIPEKCKDARAFASQERPCLRPDHLSAQGAAAFQKKVRDLDGRQSVGLRAMRIGDAMNAAPPRPLFGYRSSDEDVILGYAARACRSTVSRFCRW
jgi:hypothetical protein